MFPTLQLVRRPGIIDLGWGHPDAALLPIAEMQRAAMATIQHSGHAALSYGADPGAGPLLEWLHARISSTERALDPAEIALTGGASDALDQICTLWTRPGDTVLVEAPTYHLAMRILRDHDLRIVAVPTDDGGLRIDALAATLDELRRAGAQPAFLYTIPTFHNPTGVSLSDERRVALARLANAENLLIVEDDVYRELVYDGAAPASLWSMARRGTVMRLGSFAKSLAPGLRLGWITGSAEQIARIVGSGLRDSGGGVNHFAAMITGEFCASGAFDAQVLRLRDTYRLRRDALLDALAQSLPGACRWNRPAGGYFVWLTLPPNLPGEALLAAAEAAGMAFVPGVRFFADDGGMHALRLSFSLYAADDLREAARRLGMAIGVALRS